MTSKLSESTSRRSIPGPSSPAAALQSGFSPELSLPAKWLKVDLHLHSAEDLCDAVDYSALELLDLAHAQGFGALAITHHQVVFHPPEVQARARELGLLLIPGAELRIEKADVVVLNLTAEEAADVHTFDDLRRLRARRGASLLVFAPHPFYVLGGSIGRRRLETNLDCFDAIEVCHFHVPLLDPNARAVRFARQHGKRLLATSDCHRRAFFGQSYSWVEIAGETEVELSAEALFAGVFAGRLRLVTPNHTPARLLAVLVFLFFLHPLLKRLPAGQAKARRRRERQRAWARRRREQTAVS